MSLDFSASAKHLTTWHSYSRILPSLGCEDDPVVTLNFVEPKARVVDFLDEPRAFHHRENFLNVVQDRVVDHNECVGPAESFRIDKVMEQCHVPMATVDVHKVERRCPGIVVHGQRLQRIAAHQLHVCPSRLEHIKARARVRMHAQVKIHDRGLGVLEQKEEIRVPGIEAYLQDATRLHAERVEICPQPFFALIRFQIAIVVVHFFVVVHCVAFQRHATGPHRLRQLPRDRVLIVLNVVSRPHSSRTPRVTQP